MQPMLENASTAAPLPSELAHLQSLPSEQAKDAALLIVQRLLADLKFKQVHIDKLSLEVARLKRWRFGASSEALDAQGQPRQVDMFAPALTPQMLQEVREEAREEDRAAREAKTSAPKGVPKRQCLPEHLPRIEHHYDITPALCPQGHELRAIGQDVSEQLDCVPTQFFVHRHIRQRYACPCCQSIHAAALPAQIIDKGMPAPGLLAQVIVAKHNDHLPLYRQEQIYSRSGVQLSRSTMANWIGQCGVQLEPLVQALREHVFAQRVVHADETRLRLLEPGSGKTHSAYAWVYRTSALASAQGLPEDQAKVGVDAAVVFDFCTSRAARHPQAMLGTYSGTLVVDDYAGYKALFAAGQIQEAGCWAHVRRKFFEAHQHTQSEIARQALQTIQELYAIEAQLRDKPPDVRWRERLARSRPLLEDFKTWLLAQQQLVPAQSATARAIAYTLGRWNALMHHLSDADIPIDNNAVENAIRPLALGRKNWLFVGSEQAGQRAANLMSLIESAKLNGHDPWLYLYDVLTRLPTLKNKELHTLLPHKWCPEGQASSSAPQSCAGAAAPLHPV